MKNRLDASMNYSLIKTDKEGTFKWDIFYSIIFTKFMSVLSTWKISKTFSMF